MNEKYLEAVRTIKTAILRSQNRAAKYTNAEMLSLYYSIGGYVSGNSREGTWGTGAIDEISSRLREELPGLRGFSAGNIKLMRQFFEAWQPYFQTNTEALPDSKSVAVAIDLEQMDDTALAISQKRLPVLLRDVQDRKIRAIVCYKLDRIGRKTTDLLRLMDFLEKYNVDLLICSNGIKIYEIF